MRVSSILGLLILAGCGSVSMDPADGAPTDAATGGSATDGDATGGSATGGNDSGTGGAGGSAPSQVGPCSFEDAALAAAVRQTLGLFYLSEDEVDELESLSLGSDVSSLEGIECLTGLLEISLSGAPLEAALDLGPLGDVTSLGVLRLFGGKYEHPEVIPTLPLTHLQLTGLDWTSLDGLEGASTVEVMWIEEMPATDLSALSSFSSLWSLQITNTDTTDLSPLAEVETLQDLSVSGVPVEELTALGQIDSLVSIALFDTAISSLEGLAGAPQLTQLTIEPAPELEDLAGLEGLPSLLHLAVRGSGLSDLSALSGSTSLETVELLRADIEDVSALGTCENLYRVDLTSNRIVDLEPLGGLELEELSVPHNLIVDLGPLSGSSIESLDVSGNPLGSLDPIGTLVGLGSLSMNDVGATSIEFLAGLELASLIATHNQIADVGVVVGMPLHTLDLTDNDVVTLPSDFVSATGECSKTMLEQNPLDAPSQALLQTLCDASEEGTIRWDGGSCNHCFVLD